MGKRRAPSKKVAPCDEHVLLMPPFIAARTVDDDGKDGDDDDADADFKHVGKVRLCSDILDTLWHRAEISINQVRAIFMFTNAIL